MSFKKIWNFIWHSNSLLSWIVNVLLAFVLVKFVIFPGLGLVLQTTHPVVAVVSSSMEHDSSFDEWWTKNNAWYEANGITKEDFNTYIMKNGFNKGDIIFLKSAKEIKIGDIIVFKGNSANPIIHRVVKITNNIYQTKGDNNKDSFAQLGETQITKNDVIGKALFEVPLLGWIKIWFTELINLLGGR